MITFFVSTVFAVLPRGELNLCQKNHYVWLSEVPLSLQRIYLFQIEKKHQNEMVLTKRIAFAVDNKQANSLQSVLDILFEKKLNFEKIDVSIKKCSAVRHSQWILFPAGFAIAAKTWEKLPRQQQRIVEGFYRYPHISGHIAMFYHK